MHVSNTLEVVIQVTLRYIKCLEVHSTAVSTVGNVSCKIRGKIIIMSKTTEIDTKVKNSNAKFLYTFF